MKIAVIGAGAIGNLVAGYLKSKGEDVLLVGHGDSVKAIAAHGLKISGVRQDYHVPIDITERLQLVADLVILAVKTQDLEEALKRNLEFLKDSTIVTVQNGVQADNIVAGYIPKENIISSIVMFGATSLVAGKVTHNFDGCWIIGKIFAKNDQKTILISEVLNKAFPVLVAENILGMKYLKIFVNANNCIPAILGVSMQEAFSDIDISRIGIAIWQEGLNIVNKAGINLTSLPDFPLERLTKLTSLPIQEAAKIYSGIMLKLSLEPLYGSILQSIKRGRPSEIDYINGEFVALSKKMNLGAVLNERMVELVHRVEKTKTFLNKEALLSNTKNLVN